jgi:TolA-binding protein
VAAQVGLGRAHLADGLARKDTKLLRQAQFAFAQAYVLDWKDGPFTAQALYYLGQCLLALGPDRAGKDCIARAKEYFQQVVRFYPTSDWALLAQKKI